MRYGVTPGRSSGATATTRLGCGAHPWYSARRRQRDRHPRRCPDGPVGAGRRRDPSARRSSALPASLPQRANREPYCNRASPGATGNHPARNRRKMRQTPSSRPGRSRVVRIPARACIRGLSGEVPFRMRRCRGATRGNQASTTSNSRERPPTTLSGIVLRRLRSIKLTTRPDAQEQGAS